VSTHLGSCQFSIPNGSTTAITPTVTWDDAGSGRTITALLFVARSGANGSSATGNLSGSFGMTDGTRHWATGKFKTDNATASNGGMRVTNDGVLVECDTATPGAATGLLVFTSFGSANDQFTVTPSDAFLLDHDVKVFAVYDSDGQAYVHQAALPGATGAFSVTGIPFQPKAGIFIQSFPINIDSGNATIAYSLGLVDAAANQAVVFHRYEDAATANYVHGGLNTSLMIALPGGTIGGAHGSAVSFTSWTSDGFTGNRTVGTNGRQYAVLLIGGSDTNKLVMTTAQDATGTFGLAVAGLTPRAAILIADNVSIASQAACAEATQVSVGFCSPESQWAQTFVSANRETVGGGQETEEYSRGVTNATMIHYDRTGVDTLAAAGIIVESAWADELLTLDQTDADTVEYLIAALIFGAVFGTGTSPRLVNRAGVTHSLVNNGLVG
jgi:hypothetical protein